MKNLFSTRLLFSLILLASRQSTASCREQLNTGPTISALNAAKTALDAIHSALLPPRIAELATRVRLEWIKYATHEKGIEAVGQISAAAMENEYRFFLQKIAQYHTAWLNYHARVPNKVNQSNVQYAHSVFNVIQQGVARRGFPVYSDLIRLGLLAKDLGNAPNSSQSPRYDRSENISRWELGSKAILGNFFQVFMFVMSAEGHHLGFRILNDYSAAAVGAIEIPTIDPGQSLDVDGVSFDFSFFIQHDFTHAHAIHSSAGKVGINAEILLNESTKLNENFVLAVSFNLRERYARYQKARVCIDSIVDKKMRTLAEGIWFMLDHEYSVAYSSSQNAVDDQLKSVTGNSPSFSHHILKRFRNRNDVGQAFRDPAWIQENHIKFILEDFGKIAGLRFE